MTKTIDDASLVNLDSYVWVKPLQSLCMFYEDEKGKIVGNDDGAWKVTEDEIVRYPKWLAEFGIKAGEC